MGENVATDRLPAVCTSEQGTRSRVGLHLVRHEGNEVELFGDQDKPAEEDTQLLLALAELSTADVVSTEKVENAVDQEETILAADEHLWQFLEDFILLLAVVGALNVDVLHDGLPVHTKAFRDLNKSFWAEGAFCIWKMSAFATKI